MQEAITNAEYQERADREGFAMNGADLLELAYTRRPIFMIGNSAEESFTPWT